ncbi:DUF7660 family protein [Dyadobacter fermentans]|uniref:DUF7660 family protein n=1 Tax=Dyadobacter fermentans TaxID=94254 RepID=UPI001CBFA5A4|nr:hypothetical protein [Dyadobacter fermentans]MBZ1357437.1 hypothetical protein [Dyadobacter fermentans]
MTDTILHFKATSRQAFSQFIELLRQDLAQNPQNWENKTLDDFLAAESSYTEDIQGYYDNTSAGANADLADWQIFADIFKGATIYE